MREKQNIVPVLETISYGSYIAYVFDPATSCDQCDANRTVTVINPVIVIFDWAVDKVGGGGYNARLADGCCPAAGGPTRAAGPPGWCECGWPHPGGVGGAGGG